MNYRLKIIIIMLLTTTMYSQVKEVKYVSFGQLEDSMRIFPKPILIKITTNWCAICKLQDQQILKDPELLKVLAEKYYLVELNAETKETIVFNNKKYNYIPNGTSSGIHELAYMLGNQKGQLSYPTWVIIDQNYNIIFQYGGVLKSDILKKL